MKAFSRSGRWVGDTLVFNTSRALESVHELVDGMPSSETKVGLIARLANLENDVNALEHLLFQQHDVCLNLCIELILLSGRPGCNLEMLDTLRADIKARLEFFDPLGDDFVSHVIDQLGSAGKEA